MKSSIAVVADADTVTGFKLGGIKEGYVVETSQEAEETLENLIKGKKVSIIIEIPDKSGPSDRAVDPMRDLIKRVIGVEMVK